MLELRLLGTFVLTLDGIPSPSVRAQISTSLLALLALKDGKPVEREWLAAILWPDSNGEQAGYNLRRNLTDLRRILGPEAHRLHSPSPRTLALDLSHAFCDVRAFDAAIYQEQWDKAIALYTGPLLPRADTLWILIERGLREANYLQALEEVAEREMARGQYAEAIERWRLVLQSEPGRERVVRALMRALAADGNRPEALLAYRNLRLYLHEKLLGQPDEKTTALYENLRTVAPTLAKSFPVASGVRRVPLPLTPLRGREAELEQVTTLLARNRWLTLVGMGGIGKTRLALEVGRYATGKVCFIDLSALNNAELLSDTVRQALDVPQEADLVTSIGDTEILVILDNCEHLLEAVGDLLQELLPFCPQVRLLATSREPVGGAGEVLFRVAPLQDEAAWQLFTERVLAASPPRDLNDGLYALCRALDGWPLALELAAAQVRSLPLEEVMKRVRIIAPGRHKVPERQRSLQATLDWSWELLGEAERVAICRLSCFAGGWTLEAAESVSAVPAQILSALVDKSLVEFDRERYWFLEPVHQYVDEQWIDRAERETIRLAHTHHFLQLVRNADAPLKGPDAQQERQRLTTEQENLRLVLSHGGKVALELACALTAYWFQENLAKEGQYWLERLLSHYGNSDLLRVSGLHCAGVMAAARFDWVTARERANEMVALCRQLEETSPEGLASVELLKALALLGSTLNNIGQHEQAREVYKEVLATHRRHGNRVAEAQALEDLGYAARSLEDFEDADAWLNQALVLYQQQGNEDRAVSAQGQLAMVRSGRGDLVGAKNLLMEVLAGYQRLGQGASIAWAFCCLGSIERQLGELPVAREHIAEAIERFRDAGNNLFWPLMELGKVAREEGNFTEARDLLYRAREQASTSGAETMVQQIDDALATLK